MSVFVATEDDGSRWVQEEDFLAAESELSKARERIAGLEEGVKMAWDAWEAVPYRDGELESPEVAGLYDAMDALRALLQEKA